VNPQLCQPQFEQGEQYSGGLQRAIIEHGACTFLIALIIDSINRKEFRFTLIGGILSRRRLLRPYFIDP
jgi:hypothetical protein